MEKKREAFVDFLKSISIELCFLFYNRFFVIQKLYSKEKYIYIYKNKVR